jgi:hypothetical protein
MLSFYYDSDVLICMLSFYYDSDVLTIIVKYRHDNVVYLQDIEHLSHGV